MRGCCLGMFSLNGQFHGWPVFGRLEGVPRVFETITPMMDGGGPEAAIPEAFEGGH
jgi:hypothetical protein